MPEISPALYRAGEGEPLLLLHGFTGTWRHWLPVLDPLASRFEVFAPTLAGHRGGPEMPHDDAHSLTRATDHLEQHLDDIGVGDAHVAGNSMGGALALELAKRGRARSVVALAPGGGWFPDDRVADRIASFFARTTKLTRASQAQLPMLARRPKMRRLMLRDVMRHGERVPAAEAVDMALASLECTVVDDVLQLLREHQAHVQDLDQVAAPTLIAWPQYDRVLSIGPCAARYRNGIPGAEFRVLPGVGHVPMWDDPDLVVETITDWVTAHPRERAAA